MKKYVLAFAAAGVLGISALAATTSDAEARGRHGGGHGVHGGGFRHGGHFGVRHFGFRHHQHRHWGHRWGGVRVVSYGGGYGSCWRYRWTPYGYRYVNVCVRSLYY